MEHTNKILTMKRLIIYIGLILFSLQSYSQSISRGSHRVITGTDTLYMTVTSGLATISSDESILIQDVDSIEIGGVYFKGVGAYSDSTDVKNRISDSLTVARAQLRSDINDTADVLRTELAPPDSTWLYGTFTDSAGISRIVNLDSIKDGVTGNWYEVSDFLEGSDSAFNTINFDTASANNDPQMTFNNDIDVNGSLYLGGNEVLRNASPPYAPSGLELAFLYGSEGRVDLIDGRLQVSNNSPGGIQITDNPIANVLFYIEQIGGTTEYFGVWADSSVFYNLLKVKQGLVFDVDTLKNINLIEDTRDTLEFYANQDTFFIPEAIMLPMGEAEYFNLTGTTITISASTTDGTDNTVAVNPTTTFTSEYGFDNGGANDGTIRYIGDSTEMFHCAATWAATSGTNNDQLIVSMAVNGTVQGKSRDPYTMGTTSQIRGNAIHATLTLDPLDEVQLRVGNVSSTSNPTFVKINLMCLSHTAYLKK